MDLKKLIKEELDMNDIRTNLTQITFSLNGQENTIKVIPTRYEVRPGGLLVIYLEAPNQNFISNKIKLAVGDSVNNVFLYEESTNKVVSIELKTELKSWLVALKQHMF